MTQLANKTEDIAKIIASENQLFVKRFGFTLGHLLKLWIQLFAKRKDLNIKAKKIGKPVPLDALRLLRGEIPDAWIALAHDLGKTKLEWETDPGGEPIRGAIDLQAAQKPSWELIDSDEGVRWKEEALFDYGNTEHSISYARDPNQTRSQASLIFYDSSDCKYGSVQLSLDEYLTEGARRGFELYWKGNQDPNAGLIARSLAPDTPTATIEAALEERGVTAEEAAALVKWLGPAVVLLTPRKSDAELKKMAKTLGKAQDAHAKGAPIMEDAEYDALKNELHELDPQNAFFDRIPKGITSWKKVKHRFSMPLPQKVADLDALMAWIAKTDRRIKKAEAAGELQDVSYELEMTEVNSGVPISLRYEKGRLVQAITRGDGIEGEDVVRNVRNIPELRLTGATGPDGELLTGHVRGVIFAPYLANDTPAKERYDLAKSILTDISTAKNCRSLWMISHQLFTETTNGDPVRESLSTFYCLSGFHTPGCSITIEKEQVREEYQDFVARKGMQGTFGVLVEYVDQAVNSFLGEAGICFLPFEI
jgi:hypothetical protein